MDRELDIAGAASAGGWLRWRKKHAVEPGTPCANCETVLEGPYCHNCGQLAETFERSVTHLLAEGFESFFHVDGRLWRTLPDLALHPGRLTRSYLDGKRAYQVMPFRLFLVVLLILFFVGGLNLGGGNVTTLDIANPRKAPVQVTTGKEKPVKLSPEDKKDRGAAAEAEADRRLRSGARLHFLDAKWMSEHARRAVRNPELFWMTVETWAHRMAFLMLPIAALLLSVLFIFQRRFYVFDHLIFSMHSLSFQGLLLTVTFLGAAVTPLARWLLLAAPAHLFFHMRGTYGTSVLGTLLRMLLLFLGSMVGFTLLIAGLLWIGLAAMDH